MECSEGTIKSRLNYGRKSIKAHVLALEKKGTKLYCMPLVPFLYWMFRQQILAAAAPKEKLQEYTLMIKHAGFKLTVAAPEIFAYSNLIRAYEAEEQPE